ncbi:ribose-5-phosphate isomerase RpiA [bacterium]|nr:ribose-5-phosphate isomerase RpiA [bacterium]
MNQDDKKRAAAEAALNYIVPGEVLGVGTGSTVNYFIDRLADLRDKVPAAVSSSEASTERLKAAGIPVVDLNQVDGISIYVDGADEVTRNGHMIKGGGGALTREKIVAAASEAFICIADDSKLVDVLGAFPLPIEVIPMARSLVARRVVAMGGQPTYRQGFVTDNGNHILDCAGLDLTDAASVEAEINQWPGVVTVGLFTTPGAALTLIANSADVERRTNK